MTEAFQCEECGEFSIKYPGGSLSLEVSADTVAEKDLSQYEYTKGDLCVDCTVKIHEELFVADED
jgi:hypothetical protein